MTPQERQLVDDLFDRLAKLENNPRDPDAEDAIADGWDKAPNAAYALVQSVIVQEEALKRANERIQQLEAQLELALRVKLPVVIHAREAEVDLLEALTRYAKRVPEDSIPGVIHCFSGTEAFARACIDLGFYISLSGIFTFKNSERLRQMVKGFPLDRLLVETDAPFLAPVPLRGKKCEPFMVKFTALKLAEVLGIPFDELASTTSKNAVACFGLAI